MTDAVTAAVTAAYAAVTAAYDARTAADADTRLEDS